LNVQKLQFDPANLRRIWRSKGISVEADHKQKEMDAEAIRARGDELPEIAEGLPVLTQQIQ